MGGQKAEGRRQKEPEAGPSAVRAFWSSAFRLLPSAFCFLLSAFCLPTSLTPLSPFATLTGLHCPLQLRQQRDHCEDCLLRAGSLRQDDESAVCLRFAAVEQQEQDALAGHEDGSDALLRLPPSRPRQDPRHAHQAAA